MYYIASLEQKNILFSCFSFLYFMGNCFASFLRLKKRNNQRSDYQSTMASIQNVTSETEYTSMEISREFHSEDKSTYWLPKDEEEQKRLTAV